MQNGKNWASSTPWCWHNKYQNNFKEKKWHLLLYILSSFKKKYILKNTMGQNKYGTFIPVPSIMTGSFLNRNSGYTPHKSVLI